MEVLKVSKDEIKTYEKLKVISQIASVKGKIELFEKRYGCTFEKFEKDTQSKEKENFNEWDDYIEWKAYAKTLEELEAKIVEIEDVQDIAIA